VLNPVAPAAVGMRSLTCARPRSVIFGAFVQAIPDRMPAAPAGNNCIVNVMTRDERSQKTANPGVGGRRRGRGARSSVGAPFSREGSYYQPTLIAGVTQDNPSVTEEIFGPVATFQTFEGEEKAMALAAHPTYGLAAGLFTRDVSRALCLSRRLEAGTVWINRYGRSRDHILPTGGWKASGLGKDLGRDAYLANRRSKSVLIDL